MIVQPPHWYPKLSACVPATRIFLAFFGRGSNGSSAFSPFFNSTRDFLTASLASSLCSCYTDQSLSNVELGSLS